MLHRATKLISELRGLPPLEVNLRCAETAGSDPFFERIVREFYRETTRRHHKFPLVRNYQYGVTACHLSREFNDYFMSIAGAARRNYRKSRRLGYSFERLDYNSHLGDITAILKSTPVRQGHPMPADLLACGAVPVNNPVSRSPLHDYPYFGVLRDGHAYAFCGCLIAGELCLIESIYGHADRQPDGIVPMMIIDVARWVIEHHPDVEYYSYGNYFGASETMKRFKRKFGFMPHRARWILGD